MSIEVKNLTKIYGEQKAVDNISFSIGKGEIVGFLGPNGAGKSTTMKILTGYITANSGEALVCQTSVADNPITTRQKTGYLPEANPLYFDMYVREYLQFIAGVHNIHGKKATERIEEVIQITGLTPESKKKIGQLSKGYKQRVGLAAALIHDPEVLILDEPTSGLDPNQIIEIRDVIKGLGQQKTVLFSSHILQEVQAICDRVIIINKGKLVANDTLSNLQKGKTEQHIVIVQFKEPVALSVFENMEAEAEPDNRFKIRTAHPEALKKRLLELSLLHNLNIVSLQSERHSLEDIFRSLTG
jgi:ABC-2 type transport system ATP-binding protein